MRRLKVIVNGCPCVKELFIDDDTSVEEIEEIAQEMLDKYCAVDYEVYDMDNNDVTSSYRKDD